MGASQDPSPGALANQNDALWKEAYEKFKVDDAPLCKSLQDIVRADPGTVQDMPLESQLGAVLARKRRVMEDKQWVFYWQKKEIKIGPQFDKIIRLFQIVKPIGDTAAALDPIHAGIPWACASVLLPVSVS
jgi:hypothetical protein